MFPPHTRTLILDDMAGMRQMLKEILKSLGFTSITSAEDGAAGLALLNDAIAKGDPFQLVLSDWNMPKMTGLDLLRTVRSDSVMMDLPFLLVTTEGEFTKVVDALTLKVTDYVVKPFSKETVKAKLEMAWKKTQAKAAAVGAPKK